jgi:hypothetical protein
MENEKVGLADLELMCYAVRRESPSLQYLHVSLWHSDHDSRAGPSK